MRSTTSNVSQYHRESERYNCAQHIATHPKSPRPPRRIALSAWWLYTQSVHPCGALKQFGKIEINAHINKIKKWVALHKAVSPVAL